MLTWWISTGCVYVQDPGGSRPVSYGERDHGEGQQCSTTHTDVQWAKLPRLHDARDPEARLRWAHGHPGSGLAHRAEWKRYGRHRADRLWQDSCGESPMLLKLINIQTITESGIYILRYRLSVGVKFVTISHVEKAGQCLKEISMSLNVETTGHLCSLCVRTPSQVRSPAPIYRANFPLICV